MSFRYLTLWCSLCALVFCMDRNFNFDVTYGSENVDGLKERQVILINDVWPLPTIRINKGDRVLLKLTNHIDEPISLHFHGILQKGSNEMDGAAMLTQCGVSTGDSFLYNFTVDQVGTYWYHSHSHGQYGDGLRGVFLVDDDDDHVPFEYDYDIPLSVSDWYYQTSRDLIQEERFLRGAEPVVDACLFNETSNGQWNLLSNKTYYLRIVNVGMSLPQYLYLEDHTMTIVEIDGVYIEPVEVDSIYIVVGQRYGVLVKSKANPDKNYRFVQILQKMMSTITAVNWLVYDADSELESSYDILNRKQLNYPNDIDFKPLEKVKVYDKVDKQIYLQFAMENSHYSFNHNPYEPPLIPTLYSVVSSPNDSISLAESTYGNTTNTYVLENDEIVEIIVDSTHDMMKHPFHLHGHNFQVLYHGRNLEEMQVSEYPMIRDTINLNGHSKIVLRFKADNPGVWIFHCHIDWHLIQGLAITLVESPKLIRQDLTIDQSHYDTCRTLNISITGKGDGESFDHHVPKFYSNKTGGHFKLITIATALLAVVIIAGCCYIYYRKRELLRYTQLEQSSKDIELDEI